MTKPAWQALECRLHPQRAMTFW